jgi:hypothetical protein
MRWHFDPKALLCVLILSAKSSDISDTDPLRNENSRWHHRHSAEPNLMSPKYATENSLHTLAWMGVDSAIVLISDMA